MATAPAWACLDVVATWSALDVFQEDIDLRKVPGMALGGTTAYLVHPNGQSITQFNMTNGYPVGTFPTPQGVQEISGLTLGQNQLWLLDAGSKELYRLDTTGKLVDTYDMTRISGTLLGVDYQGSSQTSYNEFVIILSRDGNGQTWRHSFLFANNELQLVNKQHTLVPQVRSMVSVVRGGFNYCWLSAERTIYEELLGDGPQEGGDIDPDDITVFSSDDGIPRGPESHAASHQLVLTDPHRDQVVRAYYPPGVEVWDFAGQGDSLLYVDAVGLHWVSTIPQYDVEYGACVVRDVKFYRSEDFPTRTEGDFHFAHPFDRNHPGAEPYYHDATGGYEAQDVLSFIESNTGTHMYQIITQNVAGNYVVRHGRTLFDGPGALGPGRVEAWYTVRMKVCEATQNIEPHLVGPYHEIPASILTLYTYDGDGDGFGDDNPDTCWDDYFMLDSDEVHDHLLASGALSETSIYWQARRIHDYIKRRHVYSGSDGGWAKPDHKLESAYATCSPTSFMVAALAREMNLPARIVGTSIQRRNPLRVGEKAYDEMFHRWAQIYMPRYGWVRIDATPSSPSRVGMIDVNGDGKYNVCDLCTNPSMCYTVYDKTYADCDLDPCTFVNVNDINGDGRVDSDDIEIIGAWYYTDARLSSSFNRGVSARDLITIVSAGVPQNRLDLQYISMLCEDGGTAYCDATPLEPEDPCRYVCWTNPFHIAQVLWLDLSTLTWTTSGEGEGNELLRFDLYQVLPQSGGAEYRFVKNLAHDVPAQAGTVNVNLGTLSPSLTYVAAASLQGGPYRQCYSRLAQADWDTFDVSPPVGGDPPACPGDLDADQDVDLDDLALFAGEYLDWYCQPDDWCHDGDIDRSGEVTLDDFARFSEAFDHPCP